MPRYNDAQISISGYYVSGAQNYSLTKGDSKELIRPFGKNTVKNYLNNGQEINFSLSWLDSQWAISNIIFGTGDNTDHITKGYDFQYEDNAGTNWVSGCFLTNYTLSATAHGPLTVDTQYQCGETDVVNDLVGDEFDDNFDVFNTKNITLSGNFYGNANSTGMCVQDFSFSIDVDRKEIKHLGQNVAQTRIAVLPINTSLDVTILRSAASLPQIQDIYDDNIFSPSGEMFLTIEYDNNTKNVVYKLPVMDLNDINEGIGLDGDALISLNYLGTMTTGDFTVIYSD